MSTVEHPWGGLGFFGGPDDGPQVEVRFPDGGIALYRPASLNPGAARLVWAGHQLAGLTVDIDAEATTPRDITSLRISKTGVAGADGGGDVPARVRSAARTLVTCRAKEAALAVAAAAGSKRHPVAARVQAMQPGQTYAVTYRIRGARPQLAFGRLDRNDPGAQLEFTLADGGRKLLLSEEWITDWYQADNNTCAWPDLGVHRPGSCSATPLDARPPALATGRAATGPKPEATRTTATRRGCLPRPSPASAPGGLAQGARQAGARQALRPPAQGFAAATTRPANPSTRAPGG